MGEVTRDQIVVQAADYVSFCLGCGDDKPLLIGVTDEKADIGSIFLDARGHGREDVAVRESSEGGILHQLVVDASENPLAILYRIDRQDSLLAEDGNLTDAGQFALDDWEDLIQTYNVGHAVAVLDGRNPEIPWRIKFIEFNIEEGLIYGHGPGTTMDHMRGHFMIDYREAARLGQSLIDKLSAPDVVGYRVTAENGTSYVSIKDGLTTWHNDLMPRSFTDPVDGEEKGDVGNVPGGEVYDECTDMSRRPAYGVFKADLSVGGADKSLDGKLATIYVGVDPETMEILPEKAGVVTRWECGDDYVDGKVQEMLKANSDESDVYMQEPLAFGINKKADPRTPDLLEGEKAFAIHVGFGGDASHIDILLSMPGTTVEVITYAGKGDLVALGTNDIQALVNGNAPRENYELQPLVANGQYVV